MWTSISDICKFNALVEIWISLIKNAIDIIIDKQQEPNMTLFNGPRKIMDTCRLTQHGTWSGEIKINYKKINTLFKKPKVCK